MMEFDQAWASLQIGNRVRVSNGSPEPAGGIARKIWRSHNHEGEVCSKDEGAFRAIKVKLDEANGVQVSYSVVEDSGDRFEPI